MSMEGDVPSPAVGVLVRVVPSGIALRGDRQIGTATLSLMPWIPDAVRSGTACFPLRDWPTRVEALLARCDKLYVSPITTSTSTTPKPSLTGLESGIPISRAAKLSAAHLGRADALWKRIVGNGDDPFVWTALASALRASQSGKTLGDVVCSNSSLDDSRDGGVATAGDVGAAAPTPDDAPVPHPDVFAYPRADAALLYGFERAREVLRAMQRTSNACRIGCSTIRTGGRRIDPATLTFAHKPWLGLDGPMIRLAGDLDDLSGASGLSGFAKRDALLAQERQAQETAYRRQLVEKARLARDQSARRTDYLRAGTVAERVSVLEAHAAKRATSLPPSACSDACGPTTDDRVAERLTDKVKSVHSLGSLPDVDEFGMPLAERAGAMSDSFEQAAEAARQRFYAVTGMPSLARLFNFVVDVEFDLDDLRREIAAASPGVGTGFIEDGAIDHYASRSESNAIPRLEADRDQGGKDDALTRYLFVTAELGCGPRAPSKSEAPRIWTLSKLRFPSGQMVTRAAGHFWPCTREEVDLQLAAASCGDPGKQARSDLRGSCAVFQYDGVVDLGVAYGGSDVGRNPRYDIVSLDTIQTVESDIQSDWRLKDRARAAGEGSAVSGAIGPHTRRTGGFALLDRWRQDQVVSQISTAREQIQYVASDGFDEQRAIVLDAEELTVAYRLDVGVLRAIDAKVNEADRNNAKLQGRDEKRGETRRRMWRSLMNRTMRFEEPEGDEQAWIETAIDGLYERPPSSDHREMREERRRRADSAGLSIASRTRLNGSERQDRAEKTVFAEEIMIAWHGDPLGVDCLDPHGAGSVRVEDAGFSMPAEGLPLGIRYSLESRDEGYRPPSLRYGWPYHFGLRPIYLGGVVLPLELAISRYERNFADGSALPAPGRQDGRRYLRHERVEAPVLTLPDAFARNFEIDPELLASPDFDRASVTTGATCLLRTARASRLADAPDTTMRIIMPPIVPLEQAALHGKFDDDRVETISVPTSTGEKPRRLVRPVDGLKAMDFAGDPIPGTKATRGGFPHHRPRLRPVDGDSGGPAVFRLAGGATARPIPFYPDPAATRYVIAARRPNSDDYLQDTVELQAYSGQIRYPDVLPLAIEIRRRGERPEPARSILDLVEGLSDKLVRLDAAGRVQSVGGGLAARHLVLALAPGEDFEIEIWCAPSGNELLRRFDIVESLSILLARDSATEAFADGTIDTICVESLRRRLSDFADVRSLFDRLQQTSGANLLCGPGGQALPMMDTMRLVAEAIAVSLGRHPIPELAATTRLRATHAVDVPLAAPLIRDVGQVEKSPDRTPAGLEMTSASCAPVDVPAGPFRVTRLTGATVDALFRTSRDHMDPKTARLMDDPSDWAVLSDDGATNAIFAGGIAVDLLTTQDVEIRATTVSPASAVFDDVKRGRSPEERARGSYRRPGTVPDLRRIERWPSLPPKLEGDESRALYGFEVAPDGRVKLPRFEATLVRLHDLQDTPIAARRSNYRDYDLLREQARAYKVTSTGDPGDGIGGESGPAPKADGTVKQAPDHDDRSSKTSWEDPAERPWRVQYVQPFSDGLARCLELTLVATSRFANLFPKPDDQLPAAERRKYEAVSECRRIWLPATKRPDRLQPRSLRPSFVWKHDLPPAASQVSSAAEARSGRPRPSALSGRRIATVTRTCSIHVPIPRPHFTSGEGERVGVVIWPPDLFVGDNQADLAMDQVTRSEQPGSRITLDAEFTDSDLGPGGAYVTRWGADPIRVGSRPERWLVPASAFLDAKEGGVGRIVSNVLMPIPRPENDPAGAGETPAREFMLVSLLTFEPRFDIDYEHWFIDVAIDAGDLPEPFVRLGLVRYQEHAKPELQVSEPIAEWVQAMPQRTVHVGIDDAFGRDGEVELQIEVTSSAGYDGVSPTLSWDTGTPTSIGTAPVMRAAVMRNDDSGPVQSLVIPIGNVADGWTALPARRTECGTSWSATITFKDQASATGKRARYTAYVEEIETFASTADEKDAAGEVVETGPRFAALVPVPALDPADRPSISDTRGSKQRPDVTRVRNTRRRPQ